MGSRPSRLGGRLRTAARALVRAPLRRPRRPETPAVVGIFHHLLLGDTLMLAALFKAARRRWPRARIVCLCPPAFLPLFAGRPWDVEAVAYDPRRPATLDGVFAAFSDGLDLALLPGDNRHALLARASGARWIRGFAGDKPGWKNALCDELIAWPEAPTALPEIFAMLADDPAGAGQTDEANAYLPGEWPAPPAPDFAPPTGAYVVLHVGASNPLRYWPPEHWLAVADALAAQGLTPVWSCGPDEKSLLEAVDRQSRYPRLWAGTLGLAGLWQLLTGSRALVCLDSGVAHLAKLVGVPTVCIFGQGSDVLFGAGTFFAGQPFAALIEREVACRDQRTLFGRELPWVRRCARRPGECADPFCIRAVRPESVIQRCHELLGEKHDHRQ